MSRWITIILLLLAALGSYAIGGILGLSVVFGLGLIFELLFWRKLFINPDRKKHKD